MLKIAHRGYSAKYKDNSIDAFIGAIEEGFDMIELDIQLCKGDEIVIFHDTMIHDKEIIDMTLTELEELVNVKGLNFGMDLSKYKLDKD